MEWSLFRKIIDECSQHKNVERVMPYLMNEPLLDEGIVDKIDYIKEKNPQASVHLLTNGSLLNGELTKRLIKSRLDWIGISFHGIRKETLEKAMGIDFERTLTRICNFIEEAKRYRDIGEFIMVTFLKHSFLSDEEREETFNFWHEKGIKRISYFNAPISRAGNVKILPQIRHQQIFGCNSIWTDEMVHILYNGDIILCCMDWRREVVLGNVYNETIFDIWNGERKEVWKQVEGKKESPSDFICKRCEEAVLRV